MKTQRNNTSATGSTADRHLTRKNIEELWLAGTLDEAQLLCSKPDTESSFNHTADNFPENCINCVLRCEKQDSVSSIFVICWPYHCAMLYANIFISKVVEVDESWVKPTIEMQNKKLVEGTWTRTQATMEWLAGFELRRLIRHLRNKILRSYFEPTQTDQPTNQQTKQLTTNLQKH